MARRQQCGLTFYGRSDSRRLFRHCRYDFGLPYPDPFIPTVTVAWILDPANPPSGKPCPQVVADQIQQWPDDSHTVFEPHRGHAGRSRAARGTCVSHRACLDLVIAVVGKRQVQDAVFPAPAGHQPVARVPRPGLDGGRDAIMLPGENMVLDLTIPAECRNFVCLDLRTLPKPVIDRECGHLAAARPDIVVHQQKQCGTVTAARNPDGNCGFRLERAADNHSTTERRLDTRIPGR